MVNASLKLTNAQNASATEFGTNVSHIAIGSDDTTPLVSDTDLGAQTFIDSAENVVVIDNIVRCDIRLDVTENNGNTQREIGTKDGATGDIYDRNLLTEFIKTSSKEAYYRLKTTYTGRNV